ncbi:hypothetical protein ACQ7B2_30060, partial [Escherichia coli]
MLAGWRALDVRVPAWPRSLRAAALPPRHAAVVLSAYAALLHNWVLPEHYREWWGYGMYFFVATAGQVFFSGALLF